MSPASVAKASSFTKQWHSEPYPSIDPQRPELSANGKVVVITGAGTGVGQAMAVAFATAGAKAIAVIGRRMALLKQVAEELQRKNHNVQVLCEPADVTQEAQIMGAFRRIADQVGPIDILCSNVATVPRCPTIKDADPNIILDGFKTNIIGMLHVVQAFLAYSAQGAVLINTSTGLAHGGYAPGMAAYASTKSAALRLMSYLAIENQHLHIVNMSPGVLIRSEASEYYAAEVYKATGRVLVFNDEPQLSGNFAVWLASPEAAFLKGKTVWANWDVDELKSKTSDIENSNLLSLGLHGVDF
ncbi:hypothetical protein VHEMI04030 [[Torrubiella] hemipterigena]|nr:hypothetical protein VHEMI04030 [[Torrubiella] hemipterigena]